MNISQEDIENIITKVLYDECEDVLPDGDVASLMEAEEEPTQRESIIGYPCQPLYKDIARMFYLWISKGECPLNELPTFDLLDESDYLRKREITLESIGRELIAISSFWSDWSQDEKFYRWRDIMKKLGKRGLLDLLGVRKTQGSVDQWPPTRRRLLETFQELHNAPSKLTVGARALAKHSHRDETEVWWGVCTGSETAKNHSALTIITKILDEATWINIHELPGKVAILEVRHKDGYGARWSVEGDSFRGFLEPQMQEGWAVGWKH